MIVLVILVGLVYSLIVNPSPVVTPTSTLYHPKADYQAAADKLTSSFWDHTKLTFNETRIVGKLEQQFPEITTATVSLPLVGQRPTVHLNIDPPALILKSAAGEYIINASGKAVAQNPNIKLTPSLPALVDQSGFKVNVGSQALSSDEIGFINQLIAQCQKSRVPISSLVLPAIAQELDLHTADQPYYVKFYLGGSNSSIQIGQFLAARHQFSLNHITPTAYLDVRVSGKVFYK